jgi:hypothetical protein
MTLKCRKEEQGPVWEVQVGSVSFKRSVSSAGVS